MPPDQRESAILDFLDRLRQALAPDYDVECEVGRGGMGTVFRARDTGLDREVAVKAILRESVSATTADRFLREAKILAGLRHPHIVVVHSAPHEKDGVLCYIMELLEGETLADRLQRGPLPCNEVHALANELLGALELVHRKGVIHRDIKPANMFLTPGGVVLTDFGIAHSSQRAEDRLTETGQLVGTLSYMAPEQLAGRAVTTGTDLYAVGLVLYEAATGRRYAESPPSSSEEWAAVYPDLVPALQRALKPIPVDRWPDAAAFREALGGKGPRSRSRALQVWLGWTAVAALLLALLKIIAGRPTNPCGATSELSQPGPRAGLAILPFGSPESGGDLGRQLARYTGTNLEWYPRWSVRPMTLVLSWWDATPPARRQACVVPALAVAVYVNGDVVTQSGGLVLHLAFNDSTATTFDLADIPGSPDDLLGWSRKAADLIAQRVYPAQYSKWRAFQGLGGSTNPQAIRDFVAGEDAFHRDSYREAEEHFNAAIAHDTNFWLAEWQLTLVRRWARKPFEQRLESLVRRHAAGLPNLYTELIDAQLEPHLNRRFAKYETVIRRFPEFGYARLLYADEVFHRGALIGIPLDSAVSLMRLAVRKDPYLDQAPGYDHIVWASIFLGHQATARKTLARRLSIAAETKRAGFSEGEERARFFKLAYLERFSPRWAALIRWEKFRDPSPDLLQALSQYVRLGLSLDIPHAERVLGATLMGRPRDSGMRANGHQARGIASMALGRPAAAAAFLDSAAALFSTPLARLDAAEWRVVFPAVAWPGSVVPGSRDDERRLAEMAAEPPLAARTAWALALASYARGDTVDGARWRSRLAGRLPRDSSAAPLLTLLDGRILAARERPEDALSLTAHLDGYASSQAAGDPFFRTTFYLSRAEWLARLGHIEDAKRTLRWYENSDLEGWPERLTQSGEVDGAASAIARLRLAELRLQSHDTAGACPLLRRVQQLWSESEPALSAIRAQVDSALRQCTR